MNKENQTFNWGLTKKAEKLNSRFAMIGFILIIIIEIITKKSILMFF
jgi:hypothetical protein